MSGPYWTKAFNPVQGCTPVSPGCANCWAKAMHERFREEPFSKVTLHPKRLSIPLRTRKPKVFFTDMCDPFHDDVPFEFVAAMFGVMAAAHRHTFLVLTKRAERMWEWTRWLEDVPLLRIERCAVERGMPILYGARHDWVWPLPNVWLGVTAEDQRRANERIPLLLATPAAHRWVNMEPLLGTIDLTNVREFGVYPVDSLRGLGPRNVIPRPRTPKLDQVIVGGESGARARPYDLAWARSIIEQCRAAGVPCFHKQVGARPQADLLVLEGGKLVESLHAHTDHDLLFGMRSRSGADPSEWPEDLRVRELAWRMP